jgi:hypothetical protein
MIQPLLLKIVETPMILPPPPNHFKVVKKLQSGMLEMLLNNMPTLPANTLII